MASAILKPTEEWGGPVEPESAQSVLGRDSWLVKERVEALKAKTSDSFDLLDPETGAVLLECREPHLGAFTKFFRFLGEYASMTPIDVVVSLPKGGAQVVRVKGGVSLMTRSKLHVYDRNNEFLGTFRRKFFSLGDAFDLVGQDKRVICQMKGKLIKREFTFKMGDKEFARVTRQWAGFKEELLKSATQYAITIDPSVPKESPARALIIAGAMCIDKMVRKKGRRVG
jgi:uncharacterized protein YxjI